MAVSTFAASVGRRRGLGAALVVAGWVVAALAVAQPQQDAERERLRAEIRQLRTDAEALLASLGDRALPENVASQRVNLEIALNAAPRADVETQTSALEWHRNRLSRAIELLRAALAGVDSPAPQRDRAPPAPLIAAADAFFAGDYEKTITLTTQATLAQPRARAHALLLRAAARYALYLLDGERQAELVEAATEDVRACRLADATVEPAERYFSPRFRQFFAATR